MIIIAVENLSRHVNDEKIIKLKRAKLKITHSYIVNTSFSPHILLRNQFLYQEFFFVLMSEHEFVVQTVHDLHFEMENFENQSMPQQFIQCQRNEVIFIARNLIK